jgi:colanic acid/amylovoran biosynthesis protein
MVEIRPLRIGLLWHSVNSGNLGVGALTESNIAILREEARALGFTPHFTVIGFLDPDPAYIGGSDVTVASVTTRRLLLPGGYWRQLTQLDCLFDIGAGDSWADIYGAKRFAFLWFSKMLAILRGIPLVMAPQTIGPFTRRLYRILAKMPMRRAFAIVARDPFSRDVAAAMVPDSNVVEAVDVAFVLPFERPQSLVGGKINVAINVSGLLFNRGYGGDNAFGLEIDYADLMRGLLAALSERADVQISLFSHVVSPDNAADDDARVAVALVKAFPKSALVPNFISPSAAKSYISGTDFVISGRMHACIAAYASGVPVVPIAYSRKFSGLFEGVLGYRHSVPVRGLSTEAALAHILTSLENRQALAAEIAEGNKRVQVAMDRYRAVIRQVFAEAVSG